MYTCGHTFDALIKKNMNVYTFVFLRSYIISDVDQLKYRKIRVDLSD
jgi:hypothetical protein